MGEGGRERGQIVHVSIPPDGGYEGTTPQRFFFYILVVRNKMIFFLSLMYSGSAKRERHYLWRIGIRKESGLVIPQIFFPSQGGEFNIRSFTGRLYS